MTAYLRNSGFSQPCIPGLEIEHSYGTLNGAEDSVKADARTHSRASGVTPTTCSASASLNRLANPTELMQSRASAATSPKRGDASGASPNAADNPGSFANRSATHDISSTERFNSSPTDFATPVTSTGARGPVTAGAPEPDEPAEGSVPEVVVVAPSDGPAPEHPATAAITTAASAGERRRRCTSATLPRAAHLRWGGRRRRIGRHARGRAGWPSARS